MARKQMPTQVIAFGASLAVAMGLSLGIAERPESREAGPDRLAATAGETDRSGYASAGSERHLILLPGGGFMTYDPGFRGRMVPAASEAGFEPHYLEYRLNDFRGAIADARSLAEELAAEHGRENVFAFGSSAGGTLATYLAGEGRVSAAVASSGLYDFRDWPWVSLYRDPDFFDRIGLDAATRRELSPIHRKLRCPLLAIHGTRDPIISYFQAVDYVAVHGKARLRRSNGGHGLYRTRPGTVDHAMQWLHATADAQALADRRLRALERIRLRSEAGGGAPARLRRLNRRIREMASAPSPRLCEPRGRREISERSARR